MKRIYYLYGEGNHPIVTVGVFKDEKGIAFARTLSIYGKGESHPLSKEQARSIVNDRFENAKEILGRVDREDETDYINEIYPRRVEDLYFRLNSSKNENRNVDILIGDPYQAGVGILKINLNAIPTPFERHLLQMDKQ